MLWESRAIIQYLANKYDTDGTLYPVEAEARARVDQRLFFDMGLHKVVKEYYFAKFMNLPVADPEKYTVVEQWIEFLEIALEDQAYVAASDEVTIADFALMATIMICHVGKFPLENYPNILKWFEMCKENVPATRLDDEVIDFTREIMDCGSGGEEAPTDAEEGAESADVE